MKDLLQKTLALVGVLVGAQAQADTLGGRSGQHGAVTKIDKGVFQLGVEGTMTMTFDQQGDDSLFRSNSVSSLAFRYFPRENLGISARGGFSYRAVGETASRGFVGSFWANYYMRLGEGMFFAPGAGFGFLSAGRQTPVDGGSLIVSDVVGGTASTEFLLAVFLGERFSLCAGPEFVLSGGTATPADGEEGASFLSLDGGLKVGLAYSY